MTDPNPNPAAPSSPSEPRTGFRIGEEFSGAKKNLPPVKLLLVGAVIIAIGWAIAAFVQRPQSAATGDIGEVVSAEVPNQGLVMAAINVSFINHAAKPFWIHTIQVELDTAGKSFTADAASAADFNRYVQAFPALREYAVAPLAREAKVDSGGQIKGTILVSFPVTTDDFAQRKLLKVTIQPYDQPMPLVLTK